MVKVNASQACTCECKHVYFNNSPRQIQLQFLSALSTIFHHVCLSQTLFLCSVKQENTGTAVDVHVCVCSQIQTCRSDSKVTRLFSALNWMEFWHHVFNSSPLQVGKSAVTLCWKWHNNPEIWGERYSTFSAQQNLFA